MATSRAGEDAFLVNEGIRVHRASATVAADADIFSIDGGNVLIKGFLGECTVAIGGGSQDLEFDLDPDDGGSNVALASLVAIDGDATGTFYTLNTTFGSAVVATLDYAPNSMLGDASFVLPPGDILMDITGSEAGEIEFWVWYLPIDIGASITAV